MTFEQFMSTENKEINKVVDRMYERFTVTENALKDCFAFVNELNRLYWKAGYSIGYDQGCKDTLDEPNHDT